MVNDSKIQKTTYVKNWVEIIAILLAAPWALYNFYFDKISTPAKEPPYLNISSNHSIEGEKDSFYLVRSTVLIKNKSKIRTIVHAGCFNLSAFEINPAFLNDDQYSGIVQKYVDSASSIPRFYEDNAFVVNTGKIVEDEWRMDPEEEYSRSIISIVPKSRFDALRFYIEIFASRKNEKKLNIKWLVDGAGNISLELRTMPENELLNPEKHAALIKKMGLGRSYVMEEFFIIEGQKTFKQ